jgi:hypothetical protein
MFVTYSSSPIDYAEQIQSGSADYDDSDPLVAGCEKFADGL